MTAEQGPGRDAGPITMRRGDHDWVSGGYTSYLGVPICITPDDLAAAGPDVVIAGTPWDGSMGMAPGTRFAPNAIRNAEATGGRNGDWTHPVVRINPLDVLTVVDYGDVPVLHGAPEVTFDRIRMMVNEIHEVGAIPVMLGGDHSVTWPHVQGLTASLGKGNVGVIHFDAHADTWPIEPGMYTSHGSGMRQLIEGGDVLGHNFVQIGLRSSTDLKTIEFMESRGMRSHWMPEIEQRGMQTVIDQAIQEALDGPEHLFLSVDIDVCDPAHAPGTGAPEPGGITSSDLRTAIRRIAHEVGLVGMDVVEVSPPYDVGVQITAVLAHRVVLEALTGIAMRRLGDLPANYMHPRVAEGPPRGATH